MLVALLHSQPSTMWVTVFCEELFRRLTHHLVFIFSHPRLPYLQVSSDDFMKQLGHASQMIPAMMNKDMSADESATLLEMLSGQFSHSDGIRGFFAVYLTSPESLTVEEVPAVLSEAVKGADTNVMVPLACKCKRRLFSSFISVAKTI